MTVQRHLNSAATCFGTVRLWSLTNWRKDEPTMSTWQRQIPVHKWTLPLPPATEPLYFHETLTTETIARGCTANTGTPQFSTAVSRKRSHSTMTYLYDLGTTTVFARALAVPSHNFSRDPTKTSPTPPCCRTRGAGFTLWTSVTVFEADLLWADASLQHPHGLWNHDNDGRNVQSSKLHYTFSLITKWSRWN